MLLVVSKSMAKRKAINSAFFVFSAGVLLFGSGRIIKSGNTGDGLSYGSPKAIPFASSVKSQGIVLRR